MFVAGGAVQAGGGVYLERDADRDPEYALRYFCEETGGPVRRWLGQEVYRSPWVWLYGITRLRTANPVARITPDTTPGE